MLAVDAAGIAGIVACVLALVGLLGAIVWRLSSINTRLDEVKHQTTANGGDTPSVGDAAQRIEIALARLQRHMENEIDALERTLKAQRDEVKRELEKVWTALHHRRHDDPPDPSG